MTHLGAALAGAAAGGLAAAEGGEESAALGRTAPPAGNPGAGLGPPTAPAGLGPCRPLYIVTSLNPAGSVNIFPSLGGEGQFSPAPFPVYHHHFTCLMRLKEGERG